VKWRFFSHLLNGGDEDAECVYRLHIEKRSGHRMQAGLATDMWKMVTDDYVHSSQALLDSMVQSGFDDRYPIPLDPEGRLLNGAHRVACALAIGLKEVPIEGKPYLAWAPAWGEAWFKEHMPGEFLRVSTDWIHLTT
jgi:hypothetical protein